MSLINSVENIFLGRNDYCYLCLNTVQENAFKLHVQDEIVIDGSRNQEISDILAFIFGVEILDSLSKHDVICEQCTRASVASYKFIKMCKRNSEMLINTINTFTNCIDNTTKHVYGVSKSLLYLFKTNDYTIDTYCVKQPMNTKGMVLKRLSAVVKRKRQKEKIDIQKSNSKNYDFDFEPVITSPEVQCNILENSSTKQKRKKIKKEYAISTSIPTSEMMYGKDEYKCKVCLKYFTLSQHLRQHYVRVHAPKEFKCTQCPRQYGSEYLLEQHKYDSHSPAVCSQCGKEYTNRHSLKMHESGHNTKLTCQDCGRHYKNRTTFNKHIQHKICQQKGRKSNQIAEYTCDYCKKKFCHKPTLRVHIQFRHGNSKVFVCTWCNKKFPAQSRLRAHIVKHTQEKRFHCEICGGKFVSKESLLYHTRIHTGERPYQCEFCDSRFLSTSRRAEHIHRHHLGTVLECEICHSKFKGRSCLVKHRKRHFNPKSRLHLKKVGDDVPNIM